MAFVPEDGTGLTDANGYVTVAFVDTYMSDRGRKDWTGGGTKKEQAIVRATDYIDKRFGKRFRGTRRNKQQGLEWPRLDAFDNDDFLLNGPDDVPRQLQKATAEYAVRALPLVGVAPDVDLAPDAGEDTPAGDLTAISEKVDVIEVSKEYSDGGAAQRGTQSATVSDTNIPEYPAADLWLAELLKPENVRRVARA